MSWKSLVSISTMSPTCRSANTVTVLPATVNVSVVSGAALAALVKNVLLIKTLTGSVTVPSTENCTVLPSVP